MLSCVCDIAVLVQVNFMRRIFIYCAAEKEGKEWGGYAGGL